METLFADRVEELAAALAFHYERGSAPEKAFRYFSIAAARAEATFANAEAAAFYRSALAQLDRLKDATLPDQKYSPSYLNEHLGDVLELAGEHASARDAFDAGVTASAPTDRIRRARLLRKIGFTHNMQRQFAEASRLLESAEERLGPEPTKPVELWWQEKLQIQLDKMFLLYWHGEAARMHELADRYRSAIEQYATPTQYGKFFQLLALSLLTGSHYRPSEECVELAEKAVSQSRGPTHPPDQAHFRFVLGLVNFFRGNFETAMRESLGALQLAERCGDLLVQVRCLVYLSAAYRCLGEVSHAENRANEAKVLATRLNMIEYIAMAEANLSWVAWANGDLTEAKRLANEALQLWHGMEEPYGFDWMALWPLISIAAKQRNDNDAIRYLKALFGPNQHPLPPEVSGAAHEVIAAGEKGNEAQLRNRLTNTLKIANKIGQLRIPQPQNAAAL